MNDKLLKPADEPDGWHSRGYLPHFDGGEIYQFITLHLGDALPQEVLEKWKTELSGETNETAARVLYQRIEKYADQGYGACCLRDPIIAAQAQECLMHWNAVRYKLSAWTIMPNHVHFLIKPTNGFKVSEIMQRYKSFTAHEINRKLNRPGKFWQEDYFDRYIRNQEHFVDTINYIENNPVKAGLCQKPSDWKFSSAGYQNKQ